ncbi:MAG TPA: hypothetical protein VE076_05640, partial [Nitrososphaeraceae archaeon]|nr:hypothetical protein [Nitrososphaeraceae archaeon]
MNRKKIISTTSKQTQLMAVAIIAASVIVAAMIVGINNNGQNLQKVMAQEVYPPRISKTETANEYKTTAAAAANSSSTNAAVTVAKAVSPNQST